MSTRFLITILLMAISINSAANVNLFFEAVTSVPQSFFLEIEGDYTCEDMNGNTVSNSSMELAHAASIGLCIRKQCDSSAVKERLDEMKKMEDEELYDLLRAMGIQKSFAEYKQALHNNNFNNMSCAPTQVAKELIYTFCAYSAYSCYKK